MDIGKSCKAFDSLLPASRSAGTANGVAVDTKGFHEVLVVLHAGVNQATGTQDVKVQECATSGGTYADIAGAAFVQVTTDNDEAIYQGRIRMTPTRKRFLRAVDVVGTAAGIAAVSLILGEAVQLPAATPAFDIHS